MVVSRTAGVPRAAEGRGAWIRYGATPVTGEQVEFAATHYRVAVLQPWETEAARVLKARSPSMVVLAYKCLSSMRSYEPGPLFSSGVSFAEAEQNGEHLFAHRIDGTRVEWTGYPRHWAAAVWEPDYRGRWIANVTAELRQGPWDGVMADNDVYDDYYGLRPPLEGGRSLADLRAALEDLVVRAGTALNATGHLLVPNIAESRRDPGRWDRHAAFGGGFEEVWLAWGPDDRLPEDAARDQAVQVFGPGLTVLRTATDGGRDHRNFRYGLAASWVFAGDRDFTFTATAHDDYEGTPHIPELSWDLGAPVSGVRRRGGACWREFHDGFAAVNLADDLADTCSVPVPEGMHDAAGAMAPVRLPLRPHHGLVLRRGCPGTSDRDTTSTGGHP